MAITIDLARVHQIKLDDGAWHIVEVMRAGEVTLSNEKEGTAWAGEEREAWLEFSVDGVQEFCPLSEVRGVRYRGWTSGAPGATLSSRS